MDREVERISSFLKLGPEPLSEEFDSDYLWQKKVVKNRPH